MWIIPCHFRPTASTESLQQLSRQINGILAEVSWFLCLYKQLAVIYFWEIVRLKVCNPVALKMAKNSNEFWPFFFSAIGLIINKVQIFFGQKCTCLISQTLATMIIFSLWNWSQKILMIIGLSKKKKRSHWLFTSSKQDQVVQSMVSLTSSLRGHLVKYFTTLLLNTLKFFVEIMREAFALQKLLTLFQQKILAKSRY